MLRIQTSDQLVNFRALGAEVNYLKQRLAKLEQDSSLLKSDVGNLSLEKYSVQSAAAAPAGSASSTKVTVDFGSEFTHFAQTVVTGATWVTSATKFTIGLYDSSPEEAALFSFQPVVSNLVVGTGFTLSVYTPIEAKGTYDFHVIGVDS